MFQNKSICADEVFDSIVRTVSGWASRGKDFVDVSLHDLNLSWVACFQGGRIVKPVTKSSWMNPPNVVLKLNFDESFMVGLSGIAQVQGYAGIHVWLTA